MDQSARLTDYVEAGLRAAHLRQSVIANNIANLATPGYRRHAVAFEDVFAEALAKGRPITLDRLRDTVNQPRTDPVNDVGNDVQLDTEISGLVKNSLLYKTYARVLGRMYQQMEMAISTSSR